MLPEPWIEVSSSLERELEAELARELSADHVLAGKTVRAIARRSDNDDVLFEVAGTGYAVVHLTWRRTREESGAWPSTALFSSLEAWAATQG
jgi:hypothetical protein